MKPFTWSWSRHRTLEACPRRYWYAYYGSRQGWRGDPSEARWQLYRMKRLVGRSQWVGQVVHDAAARVIAAWRRGESVDTDIVVDDVARLGRRVIDDARRGLPRLDPRRHPDFEALFYGDDPGDAWFDELLDDLVGQTRAWFDHPVAQRVAEVPERVVESEELRRFRVGDVSVFAALDVLMDDGQGGLVVVDWKTGRAHDPDVVDRQLGIYGLYVMQRRGPRPRRLTALQASTRDGSHRAVRLDVQHLEAARSLIHASSDDMAARLAGGGGDQAEEEDFPRLEASDPACGRCVFRRVCARE